MRNISRIAVLIALSMLIEGAFVSKVYAQAKKSEVLDFEADVIEGQKKAPELFLQLDVETSDLSAVLYDRKNFNDYHVVDSNRRPRLSNPKMTK